MNNYEKTMQLANFNITFGSEEEPMLMHFADVIFPAFRSDYIRGKKGDKPRFYFTNVEFKEVEEQHILVGNFIKDTEYDILTVMQEGELVSSPATVPTAPYSRFIIFLKNHRMVLVKNEQSSPDIRNFQATVRSMLSDYVSRKNKNIPDKAMKLPFAIVNIVGIPLAKDIQEVLRDVKQIKILKFRFFPLNNDIDPMFFAESVHGTMQRIQSNHASTEFRSPNSKEEVAREIEHSAGLTVPTLDVIDLNNVRKTIREDKFSSKVQIRLDHDVKAEHDPIIVGKALENEAINTVSEPNKRLFENILETLLNSINTTIFR